MNDSELLADAREEIKRIETNEQNKRQIEGLVDYLLSKDIQRCAVMRHTFSYHSLSNG